MTFNLFDLHSKTDVPRSWIWVEIRSEILRKKYLKALEKSTQKVLATEIAKNLFCGLSTIEKHLIRLKSECTSIPLPVLIELCTLLDISSRTANTWMLNLFSNPDKTGKKIKAMKKCSHTFAKIVGAFLADGYMQKERYTYRLKLTDGEETSVKAFESWIRVTFGISGRVYYCRQNNMWYCWFTSKIIGRYFENIFDIKPGAKSSIVKKPELIRTREQERAFVLGFLMFDGGVKTSGMVAVTSKSKMIIDDIEKILKKNCINVKKTYSPVKDAFLLESRSGRDKEQLKKWLRYFEPGTRKHKALQFFIDGSYLERGELQEIFPIHYRARVSISLIHSILQKKSGTVEDIVSVLKKKDIFVSKNTLYKYLYLLNKAKLVNKSPRAPVIYSIG
ncbi:hypothetical protein GOV11_02540 [Candidatus Woesearchaeota archaeon]|nr:hypothetical protein [Candidatus Woesearchaeota archaeon]